MLRIHLDESVPKAIAEALRKRGIDVTMPADAGLLAASDEEQLRYAFSSVRFLLTHDRDFLALAQRGAQHMGIAYCHQHARTIGEIVRRLTLLADRFEPADMIGKIEFL